VGKWVITVHGNKNKCSLKGTLLSLAERTTIKEERNTMKQKRHRKRKPVGKGKGREIEVKQFKN
jgi:hypothetical protein